MKLLNRPRAMIVPAPKVKPVRVYNYYVVLRLTYGDPEAPPVGI